MSTANINILASKKYGFSPEEVDKRAIEGERFRPVCNMHRLNKTNKLNRRQDRYEKESTVKREKN